MVKRTKWFPEVLVSLVLCSVTTLGANPPSPGESWLKWNEEARTAYVEGYLWGHEGGAYEACRVAEKMWLPKPTGLPGEKCVAKMPKYSNTPEYYVGMITQYYRSYPADQSLPIRRLLEGMTDGHPITIKQLHESYSSARR